MIYSTLGCAARQGVQSASRASPLSGHPRSGARLSRFRPNNLFVTQCTRGFAVTLSQQLQCPPDPSGRRQDLYLLLPRRGREERPQGHLEAALLHEGAAREPAALRGWPHGHQGRYRGRRRLARQQGQGREGNRLSPGPRPDAGFHRRSGGGGSRRHARRHEEARRRSAQDQPAGAGRSRHRPFGDRRRVRHAEGLRPQRRARIPAQRRALPLPEMGPDRPSRTSPSCRRAPASATRSTWNSCRRPSGPARIPRPAARPPIRTPSSAPIRTPPWSTASPFSAGASAASRRRPPCSASRSPC